MYENAEVALNEGKRRFLDYAERQNFFSKGFIDFENEVEDYYTRVHEIFYFRDYSNDIAIALGSSNPELRRSALKLVKNAVPSRQLTQRIGAAILLLSIDGNDEERLLSKRVLSLRYRKSSKIIDQAKKISTILLDAAEDKPEQYYYLYQYTGEVLLLLRAVDVLESHVIRGKASSNPEINELAADLLEKLVRLES